MFRYLLEAVRPQLVYLHSNYPIEYLQELTGANGLNAISPTTATHGEQRFSAFATPGPLFRMGFAEAETLGQRLRRHLETAA